MKIITIEEHFIDVDVSLAAAPGMDRLSPAFREAYDPASGLPHSPTPETLSNLAGGRISAMDAAGIDMQVLSALSTQTLPADSATELVRTCNDRLFEAIAEHPDRFAGFAGLPTVRPDEAADELRRCVHELGFLGTLIHGRTDDEFLSEPRFDPVLRAASQLGVPIYLHPAPPPPAVTQFDYSGLGTVVGTRLQTAAWGWHAETGLHYLHLVLHGVFDRYPDLQVVLGHWGEMVPWFLDRLEETLPPRVTGLERSISDYFRQNAYVTPSGMFNGSQLRFCTDVVGVDRIIHSVDYPFLSQQGAREFLTESGLSSDDQHAIAHANAERLFHLTG